MRFRSIFSVILLGLALILNGSGAMATDVTWPDKVTGSQFKPEDANQIKQAVNSKLDKTSPAGAITDAGSGAVISATERAKLGGIEEGAQVNPPSATQQEIVDGLESAPRLVSPAQIKTAVQTHAPEGGADQSAEEVPLTPGGAVQSTNVQAAILEVDAEKADKNELGGAAYRNVGQTSKDVASGDRCAQDCAPGSGTCARSQNLNTAPFSGAIAAGQ